MEEYNVRTTYMAKPGEVERKWYVVDADGVSLGRLSSVVASIYEARISLLLPLTSIQGTM